MTWVLNKKTGACYDASQSVEWSAMLEWEFKCFLMASHLYYHDTEFQSPIPDHVYDAMVRVLENHHAELPEWFKGAVPQGKIKEMAHAVELEEHEITEAREWATRIHNIKNDIPF